MKPSNPAATEKTEPSSYSLRLPPDVKTQAQTMANEDWDSLNQFFVKLVAKEWQRRQRKAVA